MYFFILIILIVIYIFYKLVVYKVKLNGIFIDKTKLWMIKPDLTNYLSTLSIYEIISKTNKKQPKDELLFYYTNHVLEFTIKEKYALNTYIHYISTHYGKFPFLTKNWNFVKLSNKLEKAMPFTLGKFIYLPSYYVDKLEYIHKSRNIDFIAVCDTLIHEKIHILQRYNSTIFHHFYIKYLKYIHVKSYNIILTENWIKLHFKNPDGLDIHWILQYENSYYIPLLIFTNKIKQIVIKLHKIGTKYYTTNTYIDATKWEYFKIYPNGTSVYHPNEISAYILPKLILKTELFSENITNTFDILLNNLKND